MRRALKSADAVLVCGGLGPTFDDLTREAACAALGRTMRFEPRLWDGILARFARYRIAVPEENKRQAFAIARAEILDNPHGSAPGQHLKEGKKTLSLMPGPPSEMYPMFENLVLPRLKAAHARGVHPAAYSIRLSGVPESIADEKLDAVRARRPKTRFTILASGGEVSFHAVATERTAAAAARTRAALRREIRAAVGHWAHGEGETTLEAAVGARLKSRRLTLAVAESCTGGLLGGRISSVAGSSAWFLGGAIAYANAVKVRTLRVPAKTIAKNGAVSAECAAAMARGARRAFGAAVGVAITGIAGPDGGTKEKPVGTVFVAVAGPGRAETVKKLEFHGARETVRSRAVTAALRMIFDAAGA